MSARPWLPPPAFPGSLVELVDRIFGEAFIVSHARLARGLGKSSASLRFMGDEGQITYTLSKNNRVYSKEDLAQCLAKKVNNPNKQACDYVYFIETGDFIKIGYSAGPESRINGLREASPFEIKILCVIKATRKREQKLHIRFAYLRERGEWFRKAPELLAYIERAKAREGVEL